MKVAVTYVLLHDTPPGPIYRKQLTF